MSARESLKQKLAPARVPLARCGRCLLHLPLCLCACVEPIDVATRVLVLRHRTELHKPTNTGRLVPIALRGGEVRTFGARGTTFDAAGLYDPARRTLLLYPGDDARTLTPADAHGPPVTLLVPDANWRRAQKLAAREPALARAERVRLPDGPPSSYRLRRHPDPRFLATFEAIARALGILEGPSVQERLEHAFRVMVERQLYARGQLAGEHVTGGVPGRRTVPGPRPASARG